MVGQRCRRLVHGDDPRVEADGALAISTICCSATERLAHPAAGGGRPVDAEVVEEGLGCLRCIRPTSSKTAAPRLTAEPDVLGDGALRQQVELLEDRGGCRLPGPGAGGGRSRCCRRARRVAAVGGVDTGQDLHERRLAGAVLADQPVHVAGPQVEVDIGQHRVADEALREPPGATAALGRLVAQIRRGGRSPRGAARGHCGMRHPLLSRGRQKLFAGRTEVLVVDSSACGPATSSTFSGTVSRARGRSSSRPPDWPDRPSPPGSKH